MAKRKNRLSDPRVLSEAEALSLKLQKLMHGHSEPVLGAVLIDLVSVWVAGHASFTPGDPLAGPWSAETLRATREFRAAMFSDFIRTVEALIPVSAKEIGAPHDPVDPDPERYAKTAMRPN